MAGLLPFCDLPGRPQTSPQMAMVGAWCGHLWEVGPQLRRGGRIAI